MTHGRVKKQKDESEGETRNAKYGVGEEKREDYGEDA